MKKAELMRQYEEVKDQVDYILLLIHMPGGEVETITNQNVAEKIAYIDKNYNDDLIHSNCKDIYIEDYALYLKGDTYGFAAALGFLKDGMKVAREGWNGKGMYLRYVNPYCDNAFKVTECEPVDGTLLPYIAMKTADNGFVPWFASQTDMLAEDWVIVE